MEITDSTAAAFSLTPGDTESRNITALQPSQHYICMRGIKALFTSGENGGSPMSRKGWFFRLWWAISPQCLTAGGHQSVGRPSAQQLWRFTAHSTGSDERRTLPPPGGNETSSHMYDQSSQLLLARGDSEWNSLIYASLTYLSSTLLLLEKESLLCSLHVLIHQVFQLLLQLHSHRIWSGRKAKGRMWWEHNLWV